MIPAIVHSISYDRFGTYLAASGFDVQRALKLYIWNAQMGEAFHMPVQAVEVALRNTIDAALAARFGKTWWDNPDYLKMAGHQSRGDLATVQMRIQKRGLSVTTGPIVAGLSFGFWVAMLQPGFNPGLWSSQLRLAFPNLPQVESRNSLFRSARRVVFLRNRISHHEPIFKRDLLADFAEVMKLLKWICPDTHDWIRPHCRVPELMRRKP